MVGRRQRRLTGTSPGRKPLTNWQHWKEDRHEQVQDLSSATGHGRTWLVEGDYLQTSDDKVPVMRKKPSSSLSGPAAALAVGQGLLDPGLAARTDRTAWHDPKSPLVRARPRGLAPLRGLGGRGLDALHVRALPRTAPALALLTWGRVAPGTGDSSGLGPRHHLPGHADERGSKVRRAESLDPRPLRTGT